MKRTSAIFLALAVLLPWSAVKADTFPVATFQARPQYPFDMYAKGFPGEVVVDFIVDTHGDVRNPYAVKWTNPGFIQAAVSAVSQWKFKPGTKGGRVVNTHMQVPIVFDLSEAQDLAKITDPEMLYNLGVWYLNGTSRPQSDSQALECYRRAAEKKYAPAQYAMGLMYANGRGVAQSKEEALRWFLAAADAKFGPAQCAIGMAYETGDGVPVDLPLAVSWYEKSAKQKFASGQYLFAVCLYSGKGTPKDPIGAAKQLELAARQNLVAAQVLLGQWYCDGDPLPKDFTQAFVWWTLAATTGNRTAKDYLSVIDREVSPGEKTKAAKQIAAISAEFRSTPQ